MEFKAGKLYRVIKNGDDYTCKGCILKHIPGSAPIVVKCPYNCEVYIGNYNHIPLDKWENAILEEYIPLTEYLKRLREKYR